MRRFYLIKFCSLNYKGARCFLTIKECLRLLFERSINLLVQTNRKFNYERQDKETQFVSETRSNDSY